MEFGFYRLFIVRAHDCHLVPKWRQNAQLSFGAVASLKSLAIVSKITVVAYCRLGDARRAALVAFLPDNATRLVTMVSGG